MLKRKSFHTQFYHRFVYSLISLAIALGLDGVFLGLKKERDEDRELTVENIKSLDLTMKHLFILSFFHRGRFLSIFFSVLIFLRILRHSKALFFFLISWFLSLKFIRFPFFSPFLLFSHQNGEFYFVIILFFFSFW